MKNKIRNIIIAILDGILDGIEFLKSKYFFVIIIGVCAVQIVNVELPRKYERTRLNRCEDMKGVLLEQFHKGEKEFKKEK